MGYNPASKRNVQKSVVQNNIGNGQQRCVKNMQNQNKKPFSKRANPHSPKIQTCFFSLSPQAIIRTNPRKTSSLSRFSCSVGPPPPPPPPPLPPVVLARSAKTFCSALSCMSNCLNCLNSGFDMTSRTVINHRALSVGVMFRLDPRFLFFCTGAATGLFGNAWALPPLLVVVVV